MGSCLIRDHSDLPDSIVHLAKGGLDQFLSTFEFQCLPESDHKFVRILLVNRH